MNIIQMMLKNKSAFRHMVVCAILIGIGDVLCALMDLVWVIGDMSISCHWYHWVVLSGLSLANILIIISFIWLIKSILVYALSHNKKTKDKANTKVRVSTQSHLIIKHQQQINELNKQIEEIKK